MEVSWGIQQDFMGISLGEINQFNPFYWIKLGGVS